MKRLLVAAAVTGLAAATAAPAAAVTLTCYSVGPECQQFACPPDSTTIVDTGGYNGPWLVVCAPYI